MRRFSTVFLTIYSGVLTVALAVMLFSGFAPAAGKQQFDEITVHRINVVEPDGKLRLVTLRQSRISRQLYSGQGDQAHGPQLHRNAVP
jgi:hypothetical protein